MTSERLFLIDPHKGVGPVRFGMPRAEVMKVLGSSPRTVDRREEGGNLIDQFLEWDRLQVLYGADERVVAVQFPETAKVVYPPDVNMGRSFATIVKWAKSRDPKIVANKRSFRSDALGISGRAHFDEPRLESLLVYQPHYYTD